MLSSQCWVDLSTPTPTSCKFCRTISYICSYTSLLLFPTIEWSIFCTSSRNVFNVFLIRTMLCIVMIWFERLISWRKDCKFCVRYVPLSRCVGSGKNPPYREMISIMYAFPGWSTNFCKLSILCNISWVPILLHFEPMSMIRFGTHIEIMSDICVCLSVHTHVTLAGGMMSHIPC